MFEDTFLRSHGKKPAIFNWKNGIEKHHNIFYLLLDINLVGTDVEVLWNLPDTCTYKYERCKGLSSICLANRNLSV